MEEVKNILETVLGATTFAGLFAFILVEAVKRTNIVRVEILPLVSLVLGAIAGFILAIGFKLDIPTFVAAGFIGGAMASGIYDGAKTFIANVLNMKGKDE